jgi:hypothetical protein
MVLRIMRGTIFYFGLLLIDAELKIRLDRCLTKVYFTYAFKVLKVSKAPHGGVFF